MALSREVLCNPNAGMNRNEAMNIFRKNMNALKSVLGRPLPGGKPQSIAPIISELCDKCFSIPGGRFELVPIMYIMENNGSDYAQRATDVAWHLALCGVEVLPTACFSMYEFDVLNKAFKGGNFDAAVLESALNDSKMTLAKFSVQVSGAPAASAAPQPSAPASTEAPMTLSAELISYLESKGSVEAAIKELCRLQDLSPAAIRAESSIKAAMNAFNLVK